MDKRTQPLTKPRAGQQTHGTRSRSARAPRRAGGRHNGRLTRGSETKADEITTKRRYHQYLRVFVYTNLQYQLRILPINIQMSVHSLPCRSGSTQFCQAHGQLHRSSPPHILTQFEWFMFQKIRRRLPCFMLCSKNGICLRISLGKIKRHPKSWFLHWRPC